MTRLPALIASAVLASTAFPSGAETYKWVDEQGRVHYGDVIPGKDAGLGSVELDKQGRVKKENPRTRLTPEEQRRLEQERQQTLEARQKADAQQRRDRALLSTYVRESEIDLARDRALEQEMANLKGLQARLKSASDKLDYAHRQLAPHLQAGRPGPKAYLQMRDEAQAEQAHIQGLMAQQEQAIEATKARYEADKQRFIELRAGMAR